MLLIINMSLKHLHKLQTSNFTNSANGDVLLHDIIAHAHASN